MIRISHKSTNLWKQAVINLQVIDSCPFLPKIVSISKEKNIIVQFKLSPASPIIGTGMTHFQYLKALKALKGLHDYGFSMIVGYITSILLNYWIK